MVWGYGLAFCSLLEEDQDHALAELEHAVATEADRPPQYLSFTPGPHLFLTVLAGRARDGDQRAATDAVTRFRQIAKPYPLTLHIGLRMVAETAASDGWADPDPRAKAAENTSAAAPPGRRRVPHATATPMKRENSVIPKRIATTLVAVAALVPIQPAAADWLLWRFDNALQLPGTAELTAVTAVTTDEMWVAGEYTNQGSPTRAVVARWDGQLRPVPTAPAADDVAIHLADIATAENTVVAVGQETSPDGTPHPRIERYDRTTPDAGGTTVPRLLDQPGTLTGISEQGEWIVGQSTLATDGRSQTLVLRADGPT